MTNIMWSIMVAVGIQYNGKTVEIIFGAEYWTLYHSFFGIPDNKSISKKIFAFAKHFELHLKLPVP